MACPVIWATFFYSLHEYLCSIHHVSGVVLGNGIQCQSISQARWKRVQYSISLEEDAVLSHLVMSDSLPPHGLQPARLLCSWDFPGKNTGVGSHALLQGIFPPQGLNTGLPHCRWFLYHLSHQGSPQTKKTNTAISSGEKCWEENAMDSEMTA